VVVVATITPEEGVTMAEAAVVLIVALKAAVMAVVLKVETIFSKACAVKYAGRKVIRPIAATKGSIAPFQVLLRKSASIGSYGVDTN
jgi:hypothetical protein